MLNKAAIAVTIFLCNWSSASAKDVVIEREQIGFDSQCQLKLEDSDLREAASDFFEKSPVPHQAVTGCLVGLVDGSVQSSGDFVLYGLRLEKALIKQANSQRILYAKPFDGNYRIKAHLDTGPFTVIWQRAIVNPIIPSATNIVIETENDFDRQAIIHAGVRGVCAGVQILMFIFYAVSIFNGSLYLVYALYILSMFLFSECYYPFFAGLLCEHNILDSLSFGHKVTTTASIVSNMLIVVFFNKFFEVKRHSKWDTYFINVTLFLGALRLAVMTFSETLSAALEPTYWVTIVLSFYLLVKYSLRLGGIYYLVLAGYLSFFAFALIWLLYPLKYSLWYQSVLNVGATVEIIFFSFATSLKFSETLRREHKDREHSLNQLAKIVYPHQLKLISQGMNLERTMPTGKGQACVMAFDIVGSSGIDHPATKNFLQVSLKRCEALMSEGYDPDKMRSMGYRIDEMGDGFLCSVGFPFQLPYEDTIADATLKLAVRMIEEFHYESKKFHYKDPIFCCIGIAAGTIEGYYPTTGAQEYNIYGRAIIHATRYEGMRKLLFPQGAGASLIILQSQVWDSLNPQLQKMFIAVDLNQAGFGVRDDKTARVIYYWKCPYEQESLAEGTYG